MHDLFFTTQLTEWKNGVINIFLMFLLHFTAVKHQYLRLIMVCNIRIYIEKLRLWHYKKHTVNGGRISI